MNGNLTRTVRPNGTQELCTYNAAGLLVEQKEVKGEEVLTCYTYTYDGYGNITSIEGTEAADTQEGISHLISATMTYDAGNRLLTYNGEALQYDADGNMTYGPVDGVMSELVYDCRNRLISAGGVTYTYDAENNRVSAETDAYVEEYVTDTVSASLSRVLTMTVYEKTAGKAETAGTTTTYLYGQGLISEQTGDLYLYHHYNHLGSTMLLTDAEGNVVETYTYGVYGELLSGDVSLTRFLYNGRCGVSTDDNGLYYMRQRYYNPEIKRFVNQDILTGSIGNSQSLNRYSYVQGNPVSYTDPFGLSPSGGLFSNTNFAHSFFGLLSCVPGIVGACASLADGLVYALVDKDYAMAGLCALDVVSMGLGKFATNLIRGQKMTNTGVALYRSAKLMSNVSSFGQNAIALNQNVGTILEKWDNGVSASGTDFLALGMSVFGCAISGGGILHDVGQIRQMRSDADFMSGLKSELGQFGNGIKTSFAEFAGNNNGGFFELGYFKTSGSGSSLRDLMTPEEVARYDRYWSQGTGSYQGVKIDGKWEKIIVDGKDINTRQRMYTNPGTRSIMDVKLGSDGKMYYRETIFDEYGRKIGHNDYTDHGRPDISSHTNPHYHPNPVNNPSQHGSGIPGLHPQTPK